EGAKETGTDGVELYTEAYPDDDKKGNKKEAIQPYLDAAIFDRGCGLELNAAHDLDLENLSHFARNIPGLLEVSIVHALISDALYLGLEETIKRYRQALT